MEKFSELRCCMCPNIQKRDRVCPGIPHTLHPNPSPCRFVKYYKDERGWKYKVFSGIGEGAYKARYQKPEKTGNNGWKGVGALPWRETFDKAQEDLNRYANEKGFTEWDGVS